MKKIAAHNYTLPKPENLTLKTRLDNADSFSVSDFRSIEARFRAMGSCKLLYYFPTREKSERFIKIVSHKCSCRLSNDASYAEAAAKIYQLFENGDEIHATKLMLYLIRPLYDISNYTHTISNNKLLKNRTTRRYVFYLHDFNYVVDTLYPQILYQNHPAHLYRHSKEIQSDTILNIIYRGLQYVNATSSKSNQNTNPPDQTAVRKNYKIFTQIIKELLIDPFYFLWKEEHNKHF